ncbi:MAG: hypothetical protein IJ130_01945 [Solobacterium sp.]|nr:hypothetical protein [Solobacterium sp.]
MKEEHAEKTLKQMFLRIGSDPVFRMHSFAVLSLTWNFAYALLHGLLSIRLYSWWHVSMCAWYVMIGLLRLYAVRNRNVSRSIMKRCGSGIIVLAAVLSGINGMGIVEGINPVRSLIISVAMAALTFIMAFSALRNIIKARRSHDAYQIILRNISLVSVTGSILSLQRSMPGTFGNAADRFTLMMEACTGMAAFLIILALGITLRRSAADNMPARDRRSGLQ